jgi:hypothetical protein
MLLYMFIKLYCKNFLDPSQIFCHIYIWFRHSIRVDELSCYCSYDSSLQTETKIFVTTDVVISTLKVKLNNCTLKLSKKREREKERKNVKEKDFCLVWIPPLL